LLDLSQRYRFHVAKLALEPMQVDFANLIALDPGRFSHVPFWWVDGDMDAGPRFLSFGDGDDNQYTPRTFVNLVDGEHEGWMGVSNLATY